MSIDTTEADHAEHERALVVVELVRKHRLAGTLARRGLHVVASAPASALVGYALALVTGSWELFALGMMLATITVVAGAMYWGGNALARRSFARQLDALGAPLQLPEARVVVR